MRVLRRLTMPCTFLALALLSLGAGTQSVTVTSQHFGAKTELPVQIHAPAGPGPFPAVVWLHDCSGLGKTSLHRQWTERLTGWGYLVAIPDSFTPRGRPGGVCEDVMAIDAAGPRVADAFATLRYLQSRPDVRPAQIGVQGHSHGAGTVFTLAQEHPANLHAVAGQPGFAAAVAYYPYCEGARSNPLATPLLVLIGRKDDWTPPELCEAAAQSAAQAGPPLTLQVYPAAVHAFDNVETPPMTYLGHRLGYDPQAAADSFERTRAYFGRYLKGEAAR